ncbi:hypothetical protein C2R22_13835 [Salinigranum rubrum]|uniref:Uncharacterized protein n=2 Tax=Salinigranum rubrum TaxID=755307 RepID=A0A2I8VKX5_9EURY|nr:hypothetical protein C2R22_13835 [Salinigranum rubrum]
MAGLSVAAAAAITNQSNGATVPDATRMGIYGYGGNQVFEQQGSLTVSGFSGTVQDLTPRASPSRTTDRRRRTRSVSGRPCRRR